MPVYLESQDVSADLKRFNSVLIVCCPVCPPMSLAMQQKSPFIEIFKRGFKTGAFEDYVQSIRQPLEQRGVQTGVYSTHLPCAMMCLWTEGQRRRLQQRASDYEAVLVLGCDSAACTAEEALRHTDCEVLQAMRMVGTVNATAKFRLPMTIDLDVHLESKKKLPAR